MRGRRESELTVEAVATGGGMQSDGTDLRFDLEPLDQRLYALPGQPAPALARFGRDIQQVPGQASRILRTGRAAAAQADGSADDSGERIVGHESGEIALIRQ